VPRDSAGRSPLLSCRPNSEPCDPHDVVDRLIIRKRRRIAVQSVSALVALGFILASSMATAQDLTVVSGITTDEWLSRSARLELRLNRPLRRAEERVVILIGSRDISSLCVDSAGVVRYDPGTFPLPSGVSEVVVYQVQADTLWREIARTQIKVLNAAGFERASLGAGLSLALKGVVATGSTSEPPPGARTTFQDLTSEIQIQGELERGGLGLSARASALGVSFQQEALRFGELGEDAPKVDLSSYLVEGTAGGAKISVGHISRGRHRQLLSEFSSRGVAVSWGLGNLLDVSGALMNGTSIVGWNNLSGLQRSDHRIAEGTLGLDLIPGDPGLIRVEGSFVDASVLPLNNFGGASVNDAEQSRGWALRVQLSDPCRRVRFEGGLARTRFTNPSDPLLAQGEELVAVEPTVRQARYADLSIDLLQHLELAERLPLSFSVSARHERVDPLYRAIGLSLQPDLLQNSLEASASLGSLQLSLSHTQAEDNLADIASVLKTKTRRTNGALLVALPGLLGTGGVPLPSLSYSYARLHQFGVATPTNSDFTDRRVPDQLTVVHSAGVDFSLGTATLGYRLSYADQDNRQEERETADLASRSNSLTLSLVPLPSLSVGLDGAIESSEDKGAQTVFRTRRVGGSVAFQVLESASLAFSGSATRSFDDAGTSSQDNYLFSAEAGYRIDASPARLIHWSGQLFVRYAWTETGFTTVQSSDATRFWSVNTGVTLTLH
jgi:hypothetical protein